MKKFKRTRKIVALLLSLSLITGMMPATALSAFAADSSTFVDAAIFCSDVHGSTSDAEKVFQGIKTSGVDYSTASFVGDTFTDTAGMMSTVTSAVQNALGDTTLECLYSLGSHDDASDIEDITGLLYGDESGEEYYVYAISQSDMENSSNASTEAKAFTSKVAELDQTKPMFIISHMPLHARRSDNKGASAWYDVISAAADQMDITFFWGHNHTGEGTADTDGYYVAKDGSETMSIQGGNKVTPNFTYMNAGYINANNQSPARKGVATTVKIYNDSMVFQDYNSSGEYTGTYAHNVTVAREFAKAAELTEQTFTFEDFTSIVNVTAKASDAVITNVSSDMDEVNGLFTDYVAYDVDLVDYSSGDPVAVTMTVPEDMNTANLKVYAVVNGVNTEITDYTFEDGVISFTTTSDGIFVFGAAEINVSNDAVLTKFVVEKAPKTVNYFVTENSDEILPLDISGLVVKATYRDNNETITKEIPWNNFGKVSDGYSLEFDMTKIGPQDVKLTYTYGEVTKTAKFKIVVCQDMYFDETTDVAVSFTIPSVTNVKIEDNTEDEKLQNAVDDILKNYKSYNFDFEGYTEGEAVEVTLPIPDGVKDLGVYHVADDTYITSYVKNVTNNGDGTVTFTANEFSSYVVGDNTAIVVDDPKTIEGDGEGYTTKEVYVLVNTPTAGNQYVIVNSNTAGTNRALKENTTTGNQIIVNAASGNIKNPYIETTDETLMWNATSGMKFQSENGKYYLRYSNGLTFSTTTGTDWTVGANTAYVYSSSRYRYVYNSNGTWTTSSSRNTSTYYNAYFYEKQTVKVPATVKGTYSIAGSPNHVEKIVENGSTVELNSVLIFTPESGTASTEDVSATATYTVVDGGDPKGIISGIDENRITFSGTFGTALVKVSYDVDGKTVDNYITVTAKMPEYSIVITDDENNAITETVAVKSVTQNQTKSLNTVITYEDAQGTNNVNPDNGKLTWKSSKETIATVDQNGMVTFTGAEGLVQITAIYEYSEGLSCTETVSFSVTKSQYTLPTDGTSDFPEYPNQGAVRFDKTATAVGNFSQTGLAQVELSMTGVPYGTSTKTDVVVMVDMTSSMETNDITAAKLAVQDLIETVVYDSENDKYDENIQLFVSSFSSGTSADNIVITDHLYNTTIGNDEELASAQAAITDSTNGFRDDRHSTNGTHYGVALADVHATLTREGHAENQFVVFVTDGVPTRYYYLNESSNTGYTEISGQNSDTNSLANGWFDDSGAATSTFKTEYYSYLIKGLNVPVYTIGANLSAGSDAADLINHMSSNYSADGKTSTGETKYSFTCTTNGGITDEVLAIFKSIGQSIKEAATNVVVEDKISEDYTMNFSLPSGVTSTEAGMENFYIQVVGYELDSNNERKPNPTVLEKFSFVPDDSSDLSIVHTIGATTCGATCTHVDKDKDGKIIAIDGTYFDYSNTESKGEIITWKADKLDRTELALQYFVYLKNSTGTAAANQIEAGVYETNEYAKITYTNHLGNECQQEFPVPSLSWNGAQVTYVFYLVNEEGLPVNSAGKVVPFTEAVYVTEPVKYDVTWNDLEGSENILAKNVFAKENVPNVYALYDEDANYEIRVYQTEGVDENGKNYNYFSIDGTKEGLESCNTTKVFNTKTGIRYDAYGVYSAQNVGTILDSTDADGNPTQVTTTVKATDIDYANTTVAFGVVWKPELVEDTVVVDYGLDVIVDVIANDNMAAGVTGVMATRPANVDINDGTYLSSVGKNRIENNDGIWNASKENLTSIRFEQKEIGLKEPVTFYYEAGVNYYTDATTLNKTNMYSSVTVIPATTVYYEDDFVTFTNSGKAYDKTDESGKVTASYGKWEIDGSTLSKTQAQDRPGESKISEDLDADNVYGYDKAYSDMSTYSMGSAHKVKVASGISGMASFDFYGTGFDVISMTDNTTGLIVVNVYNADTNKLATYEVPKIGENGKPILDENGNPVMETKNYSFTVDTYYGYTKNAENKWVVSVNDPNAIYQVPVIKVEGLEYGKYTAKIVASYNSVFDHKSAGSYDFYLDAIRIYDPTGNINNVANEAYVADGEAYPTYFEVRNELISKNTFDSLISDSVKGAVFIDGIGETADVANYTSYGPNNELYLADDQAVTFDLNATAKAGSVEKVQLGIKTVGGEGKVEVYGVDSNGKTIACLDETISTATDMYYDITALNGKTVVIKNSGNGATVSITNVKTTYTAAQPEEDENKEDIPQAAMFMVSRASVENAITTLNAPAVSDKPEGDKPEVDNPGSNEPEGNKPEVDNPETNEPEVDNPGTSEPEGNKPEVDNPGTDEPEGDKPAVDQPEPEKPAADPAKIVSVKTDKKTYTQGDKVKVTVTTNSAATKVKVGTKTLKTFKTKSGKKTWTTTVKASKIGKLSISAVAYNKEGIATKKVTKKVTVKKFAPKKFNVTLSKSKVKKGAKYTVTVKTSTNVKYVKVNGKKITKFTTDKKKTTRTFKVTYKATKLGKKTVKVVSYNKAGYGSKAKSKTVTVKKK